VNREDLQRGGEHRREGGQAVAAGVQNLEAGWEFCRKALQKVCSNVQDLEGRQTEESRREGNQAVVTEEEILQICRKGLCRDFCETLVVQAKDRHLQ
jgi:hypothetical protein